MNYLIRLFLVGVVVYLSPRIFSEIHVDSLFTAVVVAFVMSLLNTFVKPVLLILSLPITILTLGIFYFVITVGIVYLCDNLVSGFAVQGFLQPLLFSFVLSIVNSWVASYQNEEPR
ncbi:phage holin family protein [Marinilongibacter aquaticus]|uniref:phage holin family protein n=1 Tax=Marinilongibacter aquaticus TaxID=2975157 RepID=UPI0021BD1515|nr:phage holin family protein [Marinilongibacter aquaticus]UBM57678.1 phage holin family protein [Marinilongibacter aquaticus]